MFSFDSELKQETYKKLIKSQTVLSNSLTINAFKTNLKISLINQTIIKTKHKIVV